MRKICSLFYCLFFFYSPHSYIFAFNVKQVDVDAPSTVLPDYCHLSNELGCFPDFCVKKSAKTPKVDKDFSIFVYYFFNNN